MPCSLTKGYTLDCLEGIGGVKEVFIANWDDFDSGITFDNATGEIDTLPTATIFRYVPFRSSASYIETPQKNLENGTLFFEQKVGWTFGKLSQDKRNEFLNLAKAKCIIFVRTFDDQILCVGYGSGAFMTEGSVQSGQQKADLMGYQVMFTAEELEPASHLEAYTTTPFDNFGDITVDPPYSVVS
jgi:hypothetical protein